MKKVFEFIVVWVMWFLIGAGVLVGFGFMMKAIFTLAGVM